MPQSLLHENQAVLEKKKNKPGRRDFYKYFYIFIMSSQKMFLYKQVDEKLLPSQLDKCAAS